MIDNYIYMYIKALSYKVLISIATYLHNINQNYVHKRWPIANLRLIGGLAIDLDQSQLSVIWGPEVQSKPV